MKLGSHSESLKKKKANTQSNNNCVLSLCHPVTSQTQYSVSLMSRPPNMSAHQTFLVGATSARAWTGLIMHNSTHAPGFLITSATTIFAFHFLEFQIFPLCQAEKLLCSWVDSQVLEDSGANLSTQSQYIFPSKVMFQLQRQSGASCQVETFLPLPCYQHRRH